MNRFVKYVDLIVQTLCIGLAVLLLLTALMGHDPADTDWAMSVLYAQMILGPWQMLSSGISIFTWAPLRRMKIIHFVIAVGYILSLMLLSSLEAVRSETFLNWFITIPAWILALYYYFLTWCWVTRANTRHGSFLPHLGF